MKPGGILVLLAACLAACSNEARTIGPAMPQTLPSGDADPRIGAYQENAYQVSQGRRYFAWYGCSQCHAEGGPADRDLTDGKWRHGGGFAQVYASVASGHPEQDFVRRIAIEQLWQITAYVRDLPTHTAEKRYRLLVDQKGEAQGSSWNGPQ
jgi:cytochrome c oxidase cbb3-type subunit 3